MIRRNYSSMFEEVIRLAKEYDLTEIYQLLFDHFVQVPGILFEDNLPRPYIWAKSADTNYDVIKLNWTSVVEMKEALQAAIDEKTNNQSLQYEILKKSKYVFNSRISEIYKRTLSICSLLHITCPMIYLLAKGELGLCSGEQGFKKMNGYYIPYIYICMCGLKFQTINIAHELRHLWQRENHYFDENYIMSDEDLVGYLFQEVELDADAYACIYFENVYGVDPIKFYSLYKDVFLRPEYSNAIIMHMESIKSVA